SNRRWRVMDVARKRVRCPDLWILLAAGVALAPSHAAERNWIRQDISADDGLHLKAFGGSDITLTITSREVSSIYIRWTDNAVKIPKLVTNVYGQVTTILVSPTYNREIKKENGIPVDGRISEAYLI